MSKKEKKDWNDFGIEESKSGLNHLTKMFQSLNKCSTWLITIGLATLAFFITILFQIKKEPILPNKWLAIIAILSLIISLGFGFYFRFRFEFREFVVNFQDLIRITSNVIKSTEEYEATGEERKLFSMGIKAFSVLDDKLTEARDSLITKNFLIPLCIQAISLFLGIILSSSFMFWYIFII